MGVILTTKTNWDDPPSGGYKKAYQISEDMLVSWVMSPYLGTNFNKGSL